MCFHPDEESLERPRVPSPPALLFPDFTFSHGLVLEIRRVCMAAQSLGHQERLSLS